MKLPDDMFKQELLPYLTVHDIIKLDNACLNHEYRLQLLEKINGVILTGDKNTCMKASLFKWLGMKRIYLINMYLCFSEDDNSFSSIIEIDYVDQLRYAQHVVMWRYSSYLTIHVCYRSIFQVGFIILASQIIH